MYCIPSGRVRWSLSGWPADSYQTGMRTCCAPAPGSADWNRIFLLEDEMPGRRTPELPVKDPTCRPCPMASPWMEEALDEYSLCFLETLVSRCDP